MPAYDPNPYPTAFSAPPPPPPAAPALFELRPLSLGEILDRTFALYRRNFWLFAGLATGAAAVNSFFTLAAMLMGGNSVASLLAGVRPAPQNPAMLGRQAILFALMMFAGSIAYLVVYGLTQAATVAALSAVYTGEGTSIARAFRRVRAHWFRFVLIMLWQGWSAVWLPMLAFTVALVFTAIASVRPLGVFFMFVAAASLVYVPFAIIRNCLGIIASAIEELKVRAAMRRSKFLVSGHKARVLAIGLLVWVMSLAAGVVQQIALLPAAFTHGPVKLVFNAMALVATFVTSSMVTPIASIALCLFYLDERVRKEGFDLEVLLQRGATPPPPPAESFASPFTSELA